MAAVIPDPARIRPFADASALEAWLAANHDAQSEIYLRIYKKDSGVPTVTYAQALDVALCWGWIDGIRKSYDAQSFLQRFTPRGRKSVWSQINREHVARLIAQGRMTVHGLRHVEAARADGRWDAAYASPAAMTFPSDLERAISASAKARAFFATLDRANVYALAFRLAQLKTKEGRAKRIAAYVTMLERGESLHPRRDAKPTAEKKARTAPKKKTSTSRKRALGRK